MKWSLELAEELVREIAGPESLRLLRLLYDKENISEFELAEHLKVNINQARNSLYQLQKYNLISSTRKKDKEKGWYVYYWTFNNKNARELLLDIKEKRLKSLKEEAHREKSGEYMVCPEECVTLSTAEAMEADFRCPICEEMLEYRKDENLIEEKEKEISVIEAELEEGIEEFPIIVEEEEKPKRKPRKKAAKRKPAKRKPAKKRATRKRAPAKRKPAKRKPAKRKPAKRKTPAKRKSTRKK
jgi:transcription factor E